jgi:3-hydroxyacyl-[acyl-carrier-protein] dehydratase
VEDHWQLLREVRAKEQNRIEAEVLVPTDSLWFSGHFPGEPILPGMALISAVWQAIVRDAGERKEDFRLHTLKRVRFTQPVRPGENLSIIITGGEPGNENLYSFQVVCGENIVCSGLIAAAKDKKD